METCIVGSFLHILECCCYNITFDVLLNKCSVFYRTCFSVNFLCSSSKNYIVTGCIFSCFVCYCNCRSAYFYTGDNWCIRCDCTYNEWICIRPVAEYFLAVFITFPCMAVCVVCSLLYIIECCRCCSLVLADTGIIFICDAVTVCRDYIIVTSSTTCFARKDHSCFVANNFYIADHWSIRFFFRGNISTYCLRTSIVLAVFCCCYSNFICCCIFCYSVICSRYCNASAFYSYVSVFYRYICISQIKFINSPRECKIRSSISILRFNCDRQRFFLSCIYKIFITSKIQIVIDTFYQCSSIYSNSNCRFYKKSSCISTIFDRYI